MLCERVRRHALEALADRDGVLIIWAWVALKYQAEQGFSRWLLARRSLRHPGAIAYYFAYARSGTMLEDLAAAAGLRWAIEECFLRAKDDLGLDPRSWHGWHRHMSLVMAAAAFLARIGAEIGVFLCLKDPARPMMSKAAAAGQCEIGGFAPAPRVQIVIIADAQGRLDL